MKKRLNRTQQIELVETHNLSLSLHRLINGPPYDSYKWRRALYHALGMTDCARRDQLERIRMALELP